jgi:hypothetical protein
MVANAPFGGLTAAPNFLTNAANLGAGPCVLSSWSARDEVGMI